jgi:glucosamine 6-phosphate synthetase-like amidotransferase/phosphosugar isomerase protein
MCGVFGFVSKNGSGPDLALLKRIASHTQLRGADAFGFAWMDGAGRIRHYKQAGAIRDHLGTLALARDAVAIVGHCRWATHGLPKHNRNNHPHASGSGHYVHNGVIHNHATLAERFKIKMKTECDSEIIGRLIERSGGPLLARTRGAVRLFDPSPFVMLGLWPKPGRLVAIRRDTKAPNPLSIGVDDDSVYLGSFAWNLPGRVFDVSPGTLMQFTVPRGRSLANLHTERFIG